MKRNVNVFIGVVLCAVLCGIFVWLRSAGEEDTWKPTEIYDQVHTSASYSASYTNATFSAPSNDGGLALRMSSSSTMRRSGASFYAGATPSPSSLPSLQGGAGGRLIPSLQGGAGGRLIPSLQGGAGGRLSSGGGLYTTSSAEIKSFGGGGNGGSSMGGGSMRGASSPTSLTASSPIAYSPSPISYSSGSRGGMNMSGDELSQMSAENPAIDMASANSMPYSSFGNPAAGFYNAYTTDSYGSYSNYGSYGNYGGGPSGIRGRQNALGFNDAWWVWFGTWTTSSNGSGYQDENGNFWFDDNTLNEVYQDFLAHYWNSGMGDEPSFAEWKDWYLDAMNNDGYYTYNGRNYYWGSLTPVGDILPLIFLALLYIVFVAFKSSNSFNSLKSLMSLKSLSTPERSE